MGNHPFNVIVILFWFATMSWLVVAKVLPPLRIGEPPNYATILRESVEHPPVCWSIRMQDRTVGWAASKIVRRKEGVTELQSRVFLGHFPWDEVMPAWLGSILQGVFEDFRKMEFDKRSTLTIDPLGRLIHLESRLSIANLLDVIKVSGEMEGSVLKLSIQSGEIFHRGDFYLPPNALTSDELSPQAHLPGLRVGQTWTVPLYSPFRSPNSPLEILQAVVDREDQILWEGLAVKTHVIVYQNDPGSGSSASGTRGRAWVREDGAVLMQEIVIFKSRLLFTRLSEPRTEAIVQALGEDWNLPLSVPLSPKMFMPWDANTSPILAP